MYDDLELRLAVLPHAITLVNTEVQRTLGHCNTKAISEITNELVNVVKYGTPQAPETQPVIEAAPVQGEPLTYA